MVATASRALLRVGQGGEARAARHVRLDRARERDERGLRHAGADRRALRRRRGGCGEARDAERDREAAA
jgi:hypothetical protein